ncbi:fluoride efflux transporter CrcB [Loktanella salsilacus]|jgi:CrcB protein|uniref:fluoride efflux transporter CrcB n=1 Tax=Loktanella salsilacus TaxID=195913 RepID=UPI0020B86C40|nr:fluoride efflux transporter CrcB [Loktanella salsilacus]UTH44719.1 fluoride efflux transporter CrcB [Loktanella salsilacus]UTH48444.1 fluoride efflux transporter CrcB [Loktanella salsilacus]
MILTAFTVALGGAIGATLRWLTGILTLRIMGQGFPWGTVSVNVLGSLLMGVVVVALAEKGGMRAAPFLMTGLLGGFTTFSAFSLDAVALMERGQFNLAVAYVGGSVIIGLAALVFGMTLTRMVLA